MQMGLREANQYFSRAIREVKLGREVVFTERGRPIAVLKPLRGHESSKARIAGLRERGIIVPEGWPSAMRPFHAVRVARGATLLALRAEREHT